MYYEVTKTKKHKITKKNDSLKLTAKAPENRLFQKERIVFQASIFRDGHASPLWVKAKKKTAHPFGELKKGTSQKGASLSRPGKTALLWVALACKVGAKNLGVEKKHRWSCFNGRHLFLAKENIRQKSKENIPWIPLPTFAAWFASICLPMCRSIRWSTLTWGSKLCQVQGSRAWKIRSNELFR